MSTRIEGSEQIATLFTIFHDGVIVRAATDSNDVCLDVEIEYLAERIDPSFRQFRVRLVGVRSMRFVPWLNDLAIEPVAITDVPTIFGPELDILNGGIQDGVIQVACIQDSNELDYCGGEFFFQAEFAQVSDEAGCLYSFDALESLCKDYWSNVPQKHAGAHE